MHIVQNALKVETIYYRLHHLQALLYIAGLQLGSVAMTTDSSTKCAKPLTNQTLNLIPTVTLTPTLLLNVIQ